MFLDWYEGVTRMQVLDVLKHAERSLTPSVNWSADSFRPGRPSTSAALIFRARGYNGLAERLVGAVERRVACRRGGERLRDTVSLLAGPNVQDFHARFCAHRATFLKADGKGLRISS